MYNPISLRIALCGTYNDYFNESLTAHLIKTLKKKYALSLTPYRFFYAHPTMLQQFININEFDLILTFDAQTTDALARIRERKKSTTPLFFIERESDVRKTHPPASSGIIKEKREAAQPIEAILECFDASASIAIIYDHQNQTLYNEVQEFCAKTKKASFGVACQTVLSRETISQLKVADCIILIAEQLSHAYIDRLTTICRARSIFLYTISQALFIAGADCYWGQDPKVASTALAATIAHYFATREYLNPSHVPNSISFQATITPDITVANRLLSHLIHTVVLSTPTTEDRIDAYLRLETIPLP
jgi:hypothetical protein